MRDIGNPLSGMRESEEIMLKAGMLSVGHTEGSVFSCRALRLAEQVVSVWFFYACFVRRGMTMRRAIK
jgi:hypothetical protein